MELFVINAQKTVETLFFIPLEKIFGILYYNIVNNKLKNHIFVTEMLSCQNIQLPK